MEVFTILLRSNKQRVANVLNITSSLQNNCNIVPAIEGSTNELEFVLEDRHIHPDYYNFCLRGELACVMSHLKVWKKIVDRNLDSAIVLEDDAVIEDDFLETFQALNIPDTADFVYLFVHPDCYQGETFQDNSELQSGYFTYGTVGYWLNRQTAQDLIEMFSHNINAPVDKSISWLLSTYKKEYYCVKNNLVETNGNLYNRSPESSIGTTQRYKDGVIDFSFYLDEGDYLCYPCVDVSEKNGPQNLENTLEENRNKCEGPGFTSNGLFLETVDKNSWTVSPNTCIYLKARGRRNPAILLTGGCGYIGSHCILELLSTTNLEIVVLDNLSNSTTENLDILRDFGKIYFYEFDLTDDPLSTVFTKHNIQSVIHLAGYKSVPESCSESIKYYYNNLTGLINLIDAMKHYGVNQLIFSSSATVYDIKNSSLPIGETSPTCPNNPYGQTKLMSEQIIKDSGINSVILRYFNPVGCHPILRPDNGTNLFPQIVKAIKQKTDVKIYGNDYLTKDGTGIRDYIHVVDLAKGHGAALNKLSHDKTWDIFNLGTGQGYSVLEILEEFNRQLESQVSWNIEDRRPGDAAEVWADVSKANQFLNWKADLTLKDMVSSVLK